MTKMKPETAAPEDQAQVTTDAAAQADLTDQSDAAPLSGPADLPPADPADDAADPSTEDVATDAVAGAEADAPADPADDAADPSTEDVATDAVAGAEANAPGGQAAPVTASEVAARMEAFSAAASKAIDNSAAADLSATLAQIVAKTEAAVKKLSAEALRAAIARIEELNNGLQRDILVAELAQIKGAKLEDKGGTYRVRLYGLEVTNTGGWSLALSTWCSKARRACLSGEAV